MATIDSKHIIDELIANNGECEGDSPVRMIVEYTNAYGNKTWGVTWMDERYWDRYLLETEFVKAPKVIFYRSA
jgi:hypothetical protein